MRAEAEIRTVLRHMRLAAQRDPIDPKEVRGLALNHMLIDVLEWVLGSETGTLNNRSLELLAASVNELDGRR